MTYAEPINVFWETESSSFFSVIYGRVGYVCLEVLVAIFFFLILIVALIELPSLIIQSQRKIGLRKEKEPRS